MTRQQKIRAALGLLLEARNLLRGAESPRALARVRRAIDSTAGAVRHAEGDAPRAMRASLTDGRLTVEIAPEDTPGDRAVATTLAMLLSGQA